ncbi:MAG: hypothetical protein JRD71_03805 [Deltaproteobacteria bacterium]|nr:hypothetical protein [Deltaproteobacteria bacterium]
MNRNELEHIIRAVGEIAGVEKIIILGSQSILGQFPNFPELISQEDYSEIPLTIQSHEVLFRSIEVDIIIPESEEKTEIVDAAIGELSSFHDTFGYYVQGVDYSTSKLPKGWKDRLVEICNENTNDISGLCLEIHDLIISKLYAGRQKDIDFFHAAVKLGLLSIETLTERLNLTPMSDELRLIIEKRMERGFSQ